MRTRLRLTLLWRVCVHVLSGERGRYEREKERGERENEKTPILYKALIVPPLELLRNS